MKARAGAVLLGAAVVAAAAAVFLRARPGTAPAPPSPLPSPSPTAALTPAGPARPLLLLGWDGADPRVIEDLLAAGRMPNLRALRERGAHGRLRSHAPYLSPLLWTSVATGLRPTEHGVLDFVERTPAGGERPVSARCRRGVPLWKTASDAGRRVVVVNWWASDPPDAVNGVVISDRAVRGGQGPESVPAGDAAVSEVLERLVRAGAPDPGGRVARLREFVAETLTAQRILLARIAELHPDAVFAYSGLPDQAAHLFVQDMPPPLPGVAEDEFRAFGGVVHGCYLLLDALLGDLLRTLPADTQVLLISDHGFVYGAERGRARGGHDPRTDLLHSPEGIYAFAGEAFVAGAGPVLDLYDVAPTALAVLGLPAGAVRVGRPAPVLRVAPPPGVRVEPAAPAAPEDLPLLRGQPCGGSEGGDGGGQATGGEGAAADAADEEALEKLRALGYIGGDEPRRRPVWPLANYGRALLDAGEAGRAAEVLAEAARLRPGDAGIAFAHLQAVLAATPSDARRIEAAARAGLRDAERSLRPEVAFVLVELLLARGEREEARTLAAEAAGSGADGALTAMLAAAWTGERAEARRAATRAAALDPARTVDTIQALGESVAGVDLDVDGLLEAIAPGIPLAEVLRAPVSLRTADPRTTLARAPAAGDSAVGRLWRRRIAAYAGAAGAGGAGTGLTSRARPGASSPPPAGDPAPGTP